MTDIRERIVSSRPDYVLDVKLPMIAEEETMKLRCNRFTFTQERIVPHELDPAWAAIKHGFVYQTRLRLSHFVDHPVDIEMGDEIFPFYIRVWAEMSDPGKGTVDIGFVTYCMDPVTNGNELASRITNSIDHLRERMLGISNYDKYRRWNLNVTMTVCEYFYPTCSQLMAID